MPKIINNLLMGAQQSDLALFGYDLVMAASQSSVNYMMKTCIDNPNLPVVTMYYVKDEAGNPVAMDKESLLAKTNGTDPLKVTWDGSQPANAEITLLEKAGFLYGFEAQIGIPSGFTERPVPIVSLTPGSLQRVGFSLYCSVFTIVQASYTGEKMTGYLNQSQDKDAWVFTSAIPLKTVDGFNHLPKAIQEKLKTGKGDFSVQQLVLNLDEAMPGYNPVIAGIDPGSPVYKALDKVFLGKYVKSLKTAGEPVLHYTVVPAGTDPSSLNVTKIALGACALVDQTGNPFAHPSPDQQKLFTLNYFCAVNGDSVPEESRQLPWNWLDDANDLHQFHGIMAVNRNVITRYFATRLNDYVARNSLQLKITGSWQWEWSATATTAAQANPPDLPASGSTVLSYTYQNSIEDRYGYNGDLGQIDLTTNLTLTLDCSGSEIIVKQHLVIHLYLYSYGTTVTGNLLDRSIETSYLLKVDEVGSLSVALEVEPMAIDQSETPSSVFSGVNYIDYVVARIKQWISEAVLPNMSTNPLASATGFIFPANNVVTFKNPRFSDHQDLIAEVTYAAE